MLPHQPLGDDIKRAGKDPSKDHYPTWKPGFPLAVGGPVTSTGQSHRVFLITQCVVGQLAQFVLIGPADDIYGPTDIQCQNTSDQSR